MTFHVHRVRAFTRQDEGGNPAGVLLLDEPALESRMQETARAVGYSETAFLCREDGIWRTRYFAPKQEVPFCGHATIGAGAVLGETFGAGVYPLRLISGEIVTVEAIDLGNGRWGAALQSPPTRSVMAEPSDRLEACALFGIRNDELDERFPVHIAHAGADHLVLVLRSRQRLSQIGYPFEAGAQFMRRLGLATICLTCAESRTVFHARHPFAVGGVYEDPATGAGAAAFAGYLRDIGWLTEGRIDVYQGEDMGVPCHLIAEFGPAPGSSIRVTGATAAVSSAP